jgi:hypothetical protein
MGVLGALAMGRIWAGLRGSRWRRVARAGLGAVEPALERALP